MAIEIEVKARIKDKAALLQKLSGLGCVLSEAKTQDDMVYVEKTGTLEEFLSNKVFLRIRVQNGSKVILTAKKPKNKTDGNLIKREHEVVVDSADEARGILSLMGYQETVRTIKSRQSAHYGEYEICLDDIEGLGSFIEVEAMGDDANAEKTQEKLWEFLSSLGVSPEDKVNKGYDILMLEKAQK